MRGIKRGHQFDKVEMVKFVHPDASVDEHTRLISEAEDVLLGLELPYRLLQICTGDLSFTAANKVDLEVWSPGVEEWLEVSSCSNFLEFQARRANIKFRPEGGGKTQFVHTLNGSGLALPRIMIAIMENYQLADGAFEVPKVIQPVHGRSDRDSQAGADRTGGHRKIAKASNENAASGSAGGVLAFRSLRCRLRNLRQQTA